MSSLASPFSYIFSMFSYGESYFLTEKQHKFFTETLKLYENQNFLTTVNFLNFLDNDSENIILIVPFLMNSSNSLFFKLTNLGLILKMNCVILIFFCSQYFLYNKFNKFMELFTNFTLIFGKFDSSYFLDV